jgi:hypothetical protein
LNDLVVRSSAAIYGSIKHPEIILRELNESSTDKLDVALQAHVMVMNYLQSISGKSTSDIIHYRRAYKLFQKSCVFLANIYLSSRQQLHAAATLFAKSSLDPREVIPLLDVNSSDQISDTPLISYLKLVLKNPSEEVPNA